MSLPARASNRLSRRLSVPIRALWGPSVIGETGGKSAQTGNNRQCFENFPVRSFATETIDGANSSELSTTNRKQDQESTLLERTEKSILQRMYQKYSMPLQTNRILVAESLFQAATSQASDPRWYGPGRIGRDFRSYQALLTMHIWFLHKRLLVNEADPHNAALIQEELFDIFWIDSSNRMRAHGVNEMLINKNWKKVQQYSFMHMFHYDHCYTGDLLENPADRLEALKLTVKTHVLLLPSLHESDDETTIDQSTEEEILQKHVEHDDQAERIAWYIESQYQNILHDLPDSFFQKARIAWVDLPSFDRMVDGNTGKELPEQPINPEDILPLDWTKSIANDGSYYYWNLKTREALWERPGKI